MMTCFLMSMHPDSLIMSMHPDSLKRSVIFYLLSKLHPEFFSQEALENAIFHTMLCLCFFLFFPRCLYVKKLKYLSFPVTMWKWKKEGQLERKNRASRSVYIMKIRYKIWEELLAFFILISKFISRSPFKNAIRT